MQFSVCINGETEEQLISRSKIMLGNFLESNNIDIHTLPKIKVIKFTGQSSLGQNNQSWHIDDVSLINFVINVNGEGTDFFNEDTQQIESLGEGNGIFLIGEQGQAFFGLKSTIHKAPIVVSDSRIILKLIIDGSDKIEGYNSSLYYERLREANKHLEEFLSKNNL